ncbi:MAG: hypothetical protein AAB800_01840 [Patescibacteria group bacterium]
MALIPERAKEGVPDWELRDDPEYQLRKLKWEVQRRVIEGLEQDVEPSEQDVELLGD